jgi:hypothetical protein
LPDSLATTELAGPDGAEQSHVLEAGVGPKATRVAVRGINLYKTKRGVLPCAASVSQSYLDTSAGAVPRPGRAALRPGCSKKLLKIKVPRGMAVRAVQTCSHYPELENAQIAGMRVWAAMIGDGGEVIALPQVFERKSKKCRKWSKKRSCPAGTIAVAAEGFHNETNFVGLKLRCAQIAAR